jgi:CRISPR-associated endoribonuclease Cas6
MRLRISLNSNEASLRLPLQYNNLLQGVIYNNLDGALSNWLHEKGHAYGVRRFKLFTFSRLFGKSKVENSKISFSGPAHFYLSSVDAEILGSLAEHLLKKPEVRLGNVRCRVEEVSVEPAPEIDAAEPVRLKTLSPITAYSTLSTPDGRKKTYYYAPQESEWSDALVANLGRKAKALGWVSDIDGELEGSWVRPHRVSNRDQKILDFKGTVIKGWTGIYKAKLPEPYLRLAYDAGLGSKNSAGFGMVGVVR